MKEKDNSGNKELGVSRGFGFVTFAVEADALEAVAKLQGVELKGRKLKLEIAVKRGAPKPVISLPAAVAAEGSSSQSPLPSASQSKKRSRKEKEVDEDEVSVRNQAAMKGDADDGDDNDDADAAGDATAASTGSSVRVLARPVLQVVVWGVPRVVSRVMFARVVAKIHRKAVVEQVREIQGQTQGEGEQSQGRVAASFLLPVVQPEVRSSRALCLLAC